MYLHKLDTGGHSCVSYKFWSSPFLCAALQAFICHMQAWTHLRHKRTHLQFTYWHRCVVCGMCILTCCLVCVVFSCHPAASLAPTEQLVLTTIRQEASEPQDPGEGAGATMRARLTDRFDKSEFARIGLDDAPICVRSPKVHVATCKRQGARCLPTPGPQELQCLVTH